MTAILDALACSGIPVVFPVHRRTRKYMEEYGLFRNLPENIFCIEPLGYLDMIHLMTHAGKILTDSGRVQKEAYLLGIPCITLGENTEWVETVNDGWNVLIGADRGMIADAVVHFTLREPQRDVFGQPRCRSCTSGNCFI